MSEDIYVVIMAGGQGTRMKSTLPKILHPLAGTPIGQYAIDLARATTIDDNIYCVLPPKGSAGELHQLFANHHIVEQAAAKGTGHAGLLAVNAMADKVKNPAHAKVLFLCGDSPLFLPDTMVNLLALSTDNDLALLAFKSEHNYPYGQLQIIDDRVIGIVEAKDITDPAQRTGIYNAGIMAVKWQWGKGDLQGALQQIGNNNRSGEYYLTDLPAMADKVGYYLAEEQDCLGVNSQVDLAMAEGIIQQRLRQQAMMNGVRMLDPSSVFLSHDTKIGQGVTIEPSVFIGKGVVIGDGAVVRSFSHIVGAKINKGAVVGPFARLREGSDIGEDVAVGNFVEIKNSQLGKGAKANHLSYVGDAMVGMGANIGAGVITCNYDGVNKSPTMIGDKAFIGSNSALVAPVKIGKGAVVGAGSVITKDVADDSLAVTRAPQESIANYRNRKNRGRK